MANDIGVNDNLSVSSCSENDHQEAIKSGF